MEVDSAQSEVFGWDAPLDEFNAFVADTLGEARATKELKKSKLRDLGGWIVNGLLALGAVGFVGFYIYNLWSQ